MSSINNKTNADVMTAFNKLNQDAATNESNMSTTVKKDATVLAKSIAADGDLSSTDKSSLMQQASALLPMAGEAGNGDEWNDDMQKLVNQLASLPQNTAADTTSDAKGTTTSTSELTTNNSTATKSGTSTNSTPTVVPTSIGNASLSDTTLYPGGKGPTLEDIQQGDLADCTIDASLSSLAQNNPSAIEKMFSKNDDGTYNVTLFPKGVKTIVTIDPSTDLISGGTTGAANKADWASIIEAAASKVGFAVNNANGSEPDDAMQLLTGTGGRDGDTSDFGTTANLGAGLESEVASGKIVIAGTPTASVVNGTTIVAHHAYSVLSVQNGEVTLRNPWKDQANNGVVTMSLADYAKAFPRTYMQD